jgi:uncharacterized membrane protein YcaP (DUF421 family)
MSRRQEENPEYKPVPLAYIAWFLTVTGTTIGSLPQLFIVQLKMPAWVAVAIGLPMLTIGFILLVVAYLPERRRRYPEILERTPTPIPRYYLEEAEKE